MKQTRTLWSTAWCLLLSGALAALCWTGASAGIPSLAAPAEGAIAAPEFAQGLDWLNVGHPLRMADLRGRAVLLDFWTSDCINCMHLISDLERLERKYGDALVVIGVHSAKFDEQRDTANLRESVLHCGIDYPVVNDKDMVMWSAYGVRAWPTLVLVGPDGKLVGQLSGEGVYASLDRAIGQVLRDSAGEAKMTRTALDLKPVQGEDPPSFLSFPGNVLADAGSQRLFIADSNHNRIVVVSLQDDSVLDIIGSGEAGLSDGSFGAAELNHPQGMALDGSDQLYIADTGNHTLRRADLRRRVVTTIAGTGQELAGTPEAGTGTHAALDSPWDLCLAGGSLYIAMTGTDQIWRMDLKTDALSPFAGSGHAGRIDGPRNLCALAQPTGLALADGKLYVADSESSSIRSIDLDGRSQVATVAGGDLYDFGDRDGPGPSARLQRPLGVDYADGQLYVADTYNHKIKRISLSDDTVQTLFGTGQPGLRDGRHAQFREPGGVSVAGTKLYIADTGNDAIRVADLATGQVQTLRIRGQAPVRPREPEFTGQVVELPAQTVAPGQVTVTATVQLPPNHELNARAPSHVKVSIQGAPAGKGGLIEKQVAGSKFPINLPVKLIAGKGSVRADVTVYYCRADAEALCLFNEARLVVPLKVDAASKNRRVTISYEVTGEKP